MLVEGLTPSSGAACAITLTNKKANNLSFHPKVYLSFFLALVLVATGLGVIAVHFADDMVLPYGRAKDQKHHLDSRK